jgi:hypothetical protein
MEQDTILDAEPLDEGPLAEVQASFPRSVPLRRGL